MAGLFEELGLEMQTVDGGDPSGTRTVVEGFYSIESTGFCDTDKLFDSKAFYCYRPIGSDDGVENTRFENRSTPGFGPFEFTVAEECPECYWFEPVTVATARWVDSPDEATEQKFRDKAYDNLAIDQGGLLVYIAPTRVNLDLAMEKWPDVRFRATREH